MFVSNLHMLALIWIETHFPFSGPSSCVSESRSFCKVMQSDNV